MDGKRAASLLEPPARFPPHLALALGYTEADDAAYILRKRTLAERRTREPDHQGSEIPQSPSPREGHIRTAERVPSLARDKRLRGNIWGYLVHARRL
jgi:hypothetical protein